jgi:adenylylsulfate kinase
MESHKRTIMKTIIWRLIATSTTILLAYVWFGEWTSSISLGITANAIKTLFYYVHERAWDRIEFGRRKKVKEDYTI